MLSATIADSVPIWLHKIFFFAAWKMAKLATDIFRELLN
jgi:hypothetical protein